MNELWKRPTDSTFSFQFRSTLCRKPTKTDAAKGENVKYGFQLESTDSKRKTSKQKFFQRSVICRNASRLERERKAEQKRRKVNSGLKIVKFES